MGNIEIAKDLAKGIVDETEIQSRVVAYSPPAISSATSNVLLSCNLALADYAVTKNFAVVTYTGNGSTQNINTGIPSVDFTVSGNGSGYWLDRSVNQVKNDAGVVQASGSCVCNVSKVHIKSRSVALFNVVADGIRGVGKTIFTDLTNTETVDSRVISFNNDGVGVGSEATVGGDGTTYILYQTLYTHIKWGTTNQGKFYVEAYNPVTREGMIYYIGSGLAGHEIPHSMGVEIDLFMTKALESTTHWCGTYNSINGHIKISDTASFSTVHLFTPTVSNITMDYISDNAVNGSTLEYITYYKAKSETWTIVQYQGTGVAGNFVETRDVYGVARKPRRVIIKSVSTTGNWVVFDSKRLPDQFISLNASTAEADFTGAHSLFGSNGFTLDADTGWINASGVTYIALVEFDTNGNGGDSYFNYPTDDSNLNLTNGVFSFTDGIGAKGYNRSTESYTGTIDFAGVSDGLKWVGKTKGGGFVAYDGKPSIGMYEKTSADDNRLVFKDGKWWTTTGGELVTNGTFDTDTSGWTSYGATLSASGSVLNVADSGLYSKAYQSINVEVGAKYRVSFDLVYADDRADVYYAYSEPNSDSYTGIGLLVNSMTTGTYTYDIVAEDTVLYLAFHSDQSQTTKWDNISVYKIEPTLSTEVPTPISFLRNPVMVQSETPMYIDYNDELAQNVVESIEASGDFKGNRNIIAENLPTSDPYLDGYLWNDNGTIKISVGA